MSNEQDARNIDLAAIEARTKAATAGPWTNGTRGSGPSGDAHMCQIVARGVIDNPNIAGAVIGATWHHQHVISYVGFSRKQNIDNAEFIAHAREDVPALIAEIKHLRMAAAHPEELQDVEMSFINAARGLVNALPDCVVEAVRQEWGNTNVAVIKHWREILRAALPDAGGRVAQTEKE